MHSDGKFSKIDKFEFKYRFYALSVIKMYEVRQKIIIRDTLHVTIIKIFIFRQQITTPRQTFNVASQCSGIVYACTRRLPKRTYSVRVLYHHDLQFLSCQLQLKTCTVSQRSVDLWSSQRLTKRFLFLLTRLPALRPYSTPRPSHPNAPPMASCPVGLFVYKNVKTSDDA